MTEFVIQLSTADEHRVDFHTFVDNDTDGTVRDANHALACCREFLGTDGAIIEGRPEGKRVMFEIRMGIENTRRGESSYRGCRYQKHEPCPMNVAEAGMDIYHDLKHVLRRAMKEWKKEQKAKEVGAK